MATTRLTARLTVFSALLFCLLAGPGAAAAAAEAETATVLFALDAREGSLTPVKGKKQTYDLTLRGVDGVALSFDDRPARHVGTIRLQRMLDELFANGQAPPNAAVNASVRGNQQALMGVQLRAPRYSRAKRTLRFRVLELIQKKGASKRDLTDVVLPRHFGRTALFIDDCCWAGQSVTVFNTNSLSVSVQVNNGPPFGIEGTGPYVGWVPQAPSSGGPSFSNSTPAPNLLAPGVNYVSVTPIGSVQPVTFPVVIPNSVQIISLQLYLFSTYNSVQWTVCNNGQPIASGTSS